MKLHMMNLALEQIEDKAQLISCTMQWTVWAVNLNITYSTVTLASALTLVSQKELMN